VNSRFVVFTVTACATAAFTLLATQTSVEAASDFPFAQLRVSIHDLFSPPRRARRARAKPAAEATRARAVKVTAPEERSERRGRMSRKQSAKLSGAREQAVPQPPPRPAEAPPRPTQAARIVDDPPAPRPRPPELPPARTAAVPPANKEAPAETEVSRESPPPGPPPPSACQLRLTPDLASVHILAPISSGQCTVEDVVRLDAVMGKDGRRVAIAPPATLRCPMAESVIHWIRDEVVPVAADLGGALKSIAVDTSFECRSRNHIAGAKLSEHGHANAIDLRGFTLTNGHTIVLTDAGVARDARERLRKAACGRFTTVLGPGSDSYHENHIHLDLAERRNGYRICQWDVRDPTVVASVPLPPERPPSAPARSAKR
jgi:hypothetical protein